MAASLEQPGEINKVGLNTTRLLLALGDLTIGWLLVRQAEVALAKLDDGPGEGDSAFYAGKIAAARFFTESVLPKLAAEREIARDDVDRPDGAAGSGFLSQRPELVRSRAAPRCAAP